MPKIIQDAHPDDLLARKCPACGRQRPDHNIGCAYAFREPVKLTTDELGRENAELQAEIRRLQVELGALQFTHSNVVQSLEECQAEQRRDALDGQAALDEANNEVVRLQGEVDRLKEERPVTLTTKHDPILGTVIQENVFDVLDSLTGALEGPHRSCHDAGEGNRIIKELEVENATLQERVRELEGDRERLDWLLNSLGGCGDHTLKEVFYFVPVDVDRRTVDKAARQSEGEGK